MILITFVTIDCALFLRVTDESKTTDYPVSAPQAALMVADGANFLLSQLQNFHAPERKQ